jgi:hypothetical protein
MCGSVSAIGLEEQERDLWPYLRERLREPGRLMALMTNDRTARRARWSSSRRRG